MKKGGVVWTCQCVYMVNEAHDTKKKIQNEDKVQDCRSYQRFFSDEENIYQSVFKNQIHVRLQNLALGLIL